MIVIITAPSWAGKTTLVDHLLKEKGSKWKKPINFTTRQPRGLKASNVDENGDYVESERDDYVFLTQSQFLAKRSNGDFAETTDYNGNLYGVSKFFDRNENYLVILEPNGRDELQRFCRNEKLPFRKVFIDISRETAIERMTKRWASKEDIKQRIATHSSFEPDATSLIVDGNGSFEDVLEELKIFIN